ncbi:C-type lectin domain family 4 member E-like [Anableps anableps]
MRPVDKEPTLQTQKEENEALRTNLSEMNPGRKSSTPTCPPRPTCPKPPTRPPRPEVKGWELHGGNCYYFSTSTSTWTESRRSCVDLGGDLVKIDSREEQVFLEARLRDVMKNDEDKFWIGLTDSEEEGRWFWMDRSPLDESLKFWNKKEPDNWTGQNPAGEDCVRMGEKGGTHDLKCWFDLSCDARQKSICEKATRTGQSSSSCL